MAVVTSLGNTMQTLCNDWF